MLAKYARAKMGIYLYLLLSTVLIAIIVFSFVEKANFTNLYKVTTDVDFSFKTFLNPKTYFKEGKLNIKMPELDGFNAKFIYPYICLLGSLVLLEALLLVVAIISFVTALEFGIMPSLFILLGIVVPVLMLIGFLLMAKRAKAELLGRPYIKMQQRARYPQDEEY